MPKLATFPLTEELFFVMRECVVLHNRDYICNASSVLKFLIVLPIP